MRRSHRFAALSGAVLLAFVATGCEPPPTPWHPELLSVDGTGHSPSAASGTTGVAVSADGTKVAFTSAADLVGDGQGGGLFVRNLTTGTTGRAGTSQAAGISFNPDGTKLVGSVSRADGTVDLTVFDLAAGTSSVAVPAVNTTGQVSVHPLWPGRTVAKWNAAGTKLVFAGWATAVNEPATSSTCYLYAPHSQPIPYPCFDVYVHDLGSGQTRMVSTSADGTSDGNDNSGDPSFSPDGTKVVYVGPGNQVPAATPHGSIYLRDLATGVTTPVDTGTAMANNFAREPRISPDGHRIAFTSWSDNLGPADANAQSDVYVRDLTSGAISLVSMTSSLTAANGPSAGGVWSPDSTKVAFTTFGNNFVAQPNDTNGNQDVYVSSPGGTARLVSAANGCLDSANGGSSQPVFSPDGSRVLFTTTGTNLGAKDTNGVEDLYVGELATCHNQLISARADSAQAADHATYAGAFAGTHRIVFATTAGDIDPDDANATTDVFLSTLPQADVAITSTSGFWRDGAEEYTIRLHNAGPGTAFGVRYTATLPGGANSASGTGVDCTVSAGEVSCFAGELKAGDSVAVHVSFALTDPQPDFVVTATVTAANVDPDGSNNEATFTVSGS